MIFFTIIKIIGIQIGNACWELYCLEHGIERDGTLSKERDGSHIISKMTIIKFTQNNWFLCYRIYFRYGFCISWLIDYLFLTDSKETSFSTFFSETGWKSFFSNYQIKYTVHFRHWETCTASCFCWSRINSCW